MNKGHFTGRVGQDSVLRYTQNQTAVAGFSMAVDVGWGDRKTTLWLKVSVWGKRGESLSEYIRKGDMISICGEVSLEEWNSNGKAGANVCVNASDVTLCSGGQQGGGQQGGGQQGGYAPSSGQAAPQTPAQPDPGMGDFEDDIPF